MLGQKAKEEAGKIKKKKLPNIQTGQKGEEGVEGFLGGGTWVAPSGCVAMWA